MIEIDKNPSLQKLRWFGLLWFPAFAALLGFLVLRRGGSLRGALIVWSIGAAIAIAGLLSRRLLRWVWITMLYVTYPIGWVVSHLLLAIVYYLVLTPIGLALRATGRDPMNRKLDRSTPSYWRPRAAKQDPKSYLRQS